VSEKSILTAIGLQTSSNEFGATPEGGLVKAENCVMLGPGLVGSRRGQAQQAYAPSARPNNLWFWGDLPVVQTDDDTLEHDTGSAWVAWDGTYVAPSSLMRMKAESADQNLYITTTRGVYRVDSTATTPQKAGAPPADDIFEAVVNATTPGFLAAGSSTAYRVVIGLKDAQGITHIGAPCGRCVVQNGEADARNVNLTFPPPNDATTSMFWQLYRAKQTPTTQTQGTSTVTVQPSDELYLAYEAFFTSDQIDANAVEYTDTSPDQFLGGPLYTNGITGDTAKYQNDRPPLAYDLAWWQDRMWYGNVRWPQAMDLRIIGVGAGQDGYTGVRLGDTLTVSGGGIGTHVAWFEDDDSNAPLYYKYKLIDDTGDAGRNIELTTRSLIASINRSSSLIAFRATYTSAPSDAPGAFRIEKTDVEDPQFFAKLNTWPFEIPAGGLDRVSNVVTVTTSDPHGLVANDQAYIAPVSSADANFPIAGLNPFTVKASPPPTTYSFTVDWSGGDATSATDYYVRRATPIPQWAWTPAPPPGYFSIAVGGLSRTGSTVTATTTASHGLLPGNVVVIEPTTTLDPDFPAGTVTVETIPSTTTFTYGQTGAAGVSTTAYQSGARVASTNDEARDGIAWSKGSAALAGGPEAVPRLYFTRVGVKDKNVLRIIPLDNYLFVFKEEGVYVVTGTDPTNFRVTLYNDTIHLYSPDSVVVCGGKVYALTNQGVVALNGSGWDSVSDPIEQDLFQYFGPSLATVRTQAFGVSHETDGLYSLWMPALSGAADPPYDTPRAYVYSTSSGWTTWELERYCGRIRTSDDSLFMGDYADAVTYIQRNTKTAIDFADSTTALTVNGWDATTRTMTVDSTTGVTAGDGIIQDDQTALVLTVTNATTLVLSGGTFEVGTFASGSVDLSATSAGPCGVSIMGHNVTVPYTGDPDVDALALYNAINADSTALSYVATSGPNPPVDGIIPLGANITNYPGAAGNSITLAALGAGTTVSGATLEGGADATATAYAAIPCALKWRSITGGSPAQRKVVREFHAHWRNRDFYKGTFVVTTDITNATATKPVVTSELPYEPDTNVYPGMPVPPRKTRVHAMPIEVGRSSYLHIEWNNREAFAVWVLNGLTVIGEAASERSTE